jgi:hypothetical protein
MHTSDILKERDQFEDLGTVTLNRIKTEGKRHWEDQDLGGWTILKWILER